MYRQQDVPPPYHSYEDHSTSHQHSREENDGKFAEQSGPRDLLFAILFIFHLLAFGAILVVGLLKEDPFDFLPNPGREFQMVLSVMLACLGSGVLFSALYLTLVKNFARQMHFCSLSHYCFHKKHLLTTKLIIGTIIASVIVWIGFAVFLLASGIFTLVIAVFNAFLFFLWRHRIPFATAMLQTVSARVGDYPAMTYIAYGAMFLQVGWILLWAWTVSRSQAVMETQSNVVIYLILVFLILSFYWVSQVIKNVVHVTASGTFATWYFYGSAAMPLNPTLKAFHRSITTSFGSICLGSLIVAALKTLRALVSMARNKKNALLMLIVDCILSILEGLLRYFNMYAFTQVAIYGKTYCQAAKDTWSLLHSHGIEAIINDNIISGVLTMGAFVGAICSGIVGGVLGFLLIPELWITCAVLGLLLGFVTALVTMEVVESGVASTFVCFAMDPLALQRNDPYLYQKFQETYSEHLSFV